MSAAPRYSTADIAKNAQAREEEAATKSSAAPATPAPGVNETRPDMSADNRRIENRQIEEDSSAPLFATETADGFRHRWDSIQASFVDDPRRAVEEADALVAETMTSLAETFSRERTRLEQQFEQGTNLSTEDLRVTLRHYRSFFNRLLSV